MDTTQGSTAKSPGRLRSAKILYMPWYLIPLYQQ